MRLRRFQRLASIAATLARYRLDEFVGSRRLSRRLWLARLALARGKVPTEGLSRGARLRLALDELGPIFVKFGQILSTRRDLLPEDIADELALLQDHVLPFPGEKARDIVERSLGGSIGSFFAFFDKEPLASASIAQVHAAKTLDGDKVVAKILRPDIRARIADDVELIRIAVSTAERYWPPARKFRAREVVAEFERTLVDELNLQREGANASLLRRNFADVDELQVPEIYWTLSRGDILTMEHVYGIPIGDMKGLREAGVDLELLAERGIRIFYTQVFRDNFFHADMHPGNILVDASDPLDPKYIALDFGIVGSLPPAHQYYMAQNFDAFFEQDYRKIAQLHIDAGWVPATTRVDVLEAAVRTVCEPQLAKPLSEISFGELLFQLLGVARRFNLIVQPELVLLQKTLLNIEGLGRELHPSLDVWATAKPILQDIMRRRMSLHTTARRLRRRLPGWVEKSPDLPDLIYDVLVRLEQGKLEIQAPQSQPAQPERYERSILLAILAAGCWISAAVLGAGNAGPQLASVPVLPALVAILGVLFAVLAWRNN